MTAQILRQSASVSRRQRSRLADRRVRDASRQHARPRKLRGPDGRATEIQRLIGRSLRAVIDTKALGPWTVNVDADVLEADGGTRTAAITAAFVAVADALATPGLARPARRLPSRQRRRRERGDGRRRTSARPRLSGGCRRGRRLQRRPARSRRARGGPGNRRTNDVFAISSNRSSISPRWVSLAFAVFSNLSVRLAFPD